LITNLSHDTDITQYCLAYYSENDKEWKCQDECLTSSNDNGTLILIGKTDHLTLFSMLLGGSGCSDVFWQWASLTAIVIAIVLCVILIISILYVPWLQAFMKITGSDPHQMKPSANSQNSKQQNRNPFKPPPPPTPEPFELA